jgi:hypothetical protein
VPIPLSLPIPRLQGMREESIRRLPDGQISDLTVQPPLQKNSASPQTQIKTITRAVLSRGGALAIVTNVGAGCGGRGSVGRVT